MFRRIIRLVAGIVISFSLAWPTLPASAATLSIKVTAPNGGEVLTAGNVYHITWQSPTNIDKVSIGYKACPTCLTWIVTNIPNRNYYDWTVNVGNTTQTQFTIQITGSQTGGGSVTDYSDVSFTVLPKPTPTRTPTKTATSTITRTPTRTATRTITPTFSKTPTKTKTSSPTPTPSNTNTSTPTYTPTDTPTDTPTETYTPTDTPTDTATATYTSTYTTTPTPTPSLTPTRTSTWTATATKTVTSTSTSTNTATSTPSPSQTFTNTPSVTSTPTPTRTSTWTATATKTVTSTSTSTNTPSRTPTSTSTWTATATKTVTSTSTSTNTPSLTPTYTPTRTPTNTATSTLTSTLTLTLTTEPGTVSGVVFDDMNGNGIQDSGESGIYGVAISLCDISGSFFLAGITTDGEGHYSFGGLRTGLYTLIETLPDGYAGTTPSFVSNVAVTAGEITFVNFGIEEYTPTPEQGTFRGEVFSDVNANGILDSGESGVPGVVIKLYNNTTNSVVGVTTDASGNYSFDGLAAGEYQVLEGAIPFGYITTTRPDPGIFQVPAGGTVIVNFGLEPFTPTPTATGTPSRTPTPTITPSRTPTNTVTGTWTSTATTPPTPELGMISGVVFDDMNGNGIQEGGESGIYGVAVSIYDNTGTTFIAGTTTDGEGNYSIYGLTGGVYEVVETLPDGYAGTTPSSVSAVAVTAGGNTVVNFGVEAFTPTPIPPTPTYTATPSMWVRVTSPNGGEVMTAGDLYRITWDSSPNIDAVAIGYSSCNSCLVWITNDIPNTGSYDWTVNVGSESNLTQFKIFIVGYQTGVGSVNDISDAYFTILQKPATNTSVYTATPSNTPTITPTYTPVDTATINPAMWLRVTSPNGGEVMTAGDLYRITWDASPNVDRVSISWLSDPHHGNWVAFNIPNTGYYDWPVNVGNTTNTQFYISITGYINGGDTVTDTSDAYFTVLPAPTPTPTPNPLWITVTSPNGGEVMTVGDVYRITWDSSPSVDDVTIGYKDCDSCLNWIVNDIPNTGHYDWTVNVGGTLNTQFKIYISGGKTGVGTVADTSDAAFTVLPAPTATPTPTFTPHPTVTTNPNPPWINLTAPIGGDVLTDGDTYRVTWQSSQNIPRVDVGVIYIDTCAGCSQDWNVLWAEMSIPNTGYYDWAINVPDPSEKEFMVLVEDADYIGDPGGYDISGRFTVTIPNTPTMPANTSTVTPVWTPSNIPTDTSIAPDTETPTPVFIPTEVIPTNTSSIPDTDTPTDTAPATITPTPTATPSPAPTSIPSWLRVIAPNGGEILTYGDVYRIKWESSPNIDSVDVMVGYKTSCDGCPPDWNFEWTTGPIQNTGFFDWTVNITDTAEKDLVVVVYNPFAWDESDGPFTVVMPNTPTIIPGTETMPANTSTVTPAWTPSNIPTDTSIAPDTETPTPVFISTEVIPTNTPYIPDTDTPTPRIIPSDTPYVPDTDTPVPTPIPTIAPTDTQAPIPTEKPTPAPSSTPVPTTTPCMNIC